MIAIAIATYIIIGLSFLLKSADEVVSEFKHAEAGEYPAIIASVFGVIMLWPILLYFEWSDRP